MDNAWRQRWQEGRIGFHLSETHPALLAHWEALAVPRDAKVLVPLCGKSLDMRWLSALGHPVLGVELAPEAVRQFIAQREIPVSRYSQAGFDVSRQGNIELWCGDFFHLHIRHAAEVEAFYDRASLIALPKATRERYAFHLAQLVPPGAKGLLVSLSHDDAEAGPPFSVTDDEVERLMQPNFKAVRVAVGEADARGCRESIWALERRGPSAAP